MNLLDPASRWKHLTFALFCGVLFAAGIASPASAGDDRIALRPIGTYAAGAFNEGASEIVAHDPGSQRLFVIKAEAATVDVVDIADPTAPFLVDVIDISPFGAVVNSIDARDGVVAVAVQNAVKTDLGHVVFFETDGDFLSSVTVGALPDMLTFTPDGRWVLVANEGEPNDAYTIDPEGSVSIIDLSGGAASLQQSDVRTASFARFNNARLDPGIRVFGPAATVAQDLEPEFITVSHDSRFAWVTLQENNALGILAIRPARFLALRGLGTKDHLLDGNGLDASNQDGVINIANWPVSGMYQPDAIASYRFSNKTFLITANEGDSRDYSGFSEEARVEDVVLDPIAFPAAASLQDPAALGRLKITTANGDVDNDGDFERLFSFGARSFAIWTANGQLLFDSGDQLEQITAAALPDDFNSTDEENQSFDDRSDDKGPEPEGVAVGRIGDRTFAFLGLERIGGIMVWDVTNPLEVSFVQYVTTRDFSGDPLLGTAGDLAPEGIIFIAEEDSPNASPLLVVGHEVSGTAVIFEITTDDGDSDSDDG